VSLFWLASLALVLPAGAGTVIAYEVCRRHVLDKDTTMWAAASKAWRQSWKQATVVGLLAAAVAGLGLLTFSYAATLGTSQVLVPLLVTAFFLMILLFWCLPLVARFHNSTWRQLRNGFTLGLATPQLSFLLAVVLLVVGTLVWTMPPLVFAAPGLVLLWWCHMLERFFVDRGFVKPVPLPDESEAES